MAISFLVRAFFISGMCCTSIYSKEIILEKCWSVLVALAKQMLRSFIFLKCLSMLLLTPASYFDFPSYLLFCTCFFLFGSFFSNLLFPLRIVFSCVILCGEPENAQYTGSSFYVLVQCCSSMWLVT